MRVSSGSHLQAELKKQCQHALGLDLPGRWRFRYGGSGRFDVCLVKNRKRVDPATNHRALFAPATRPTPACLHFSKDQRAAFSVPAKASEGLTAVSTPSTICDASLVLRRVGIQQSCTRLHVGCRGYVHRMWMQAMVTATSHPPRSRCKPP